MKKLMALGCAVLPLWASEADGASAGTPTQTEIISSHGAGGVSAAAIAARPFSMHDVCGVVAEFLDDLHAVCATSSIFHQAALAYAKAIQAGEPVAQDFMRVLGAARNEETKAFVRQTILNALKKGDSNIIHLPKQLTPFLKDYVTEKTAEVQKKIDDMVLFPVVALHPAIAEHMKPRIGHYYEIKSQPWSEGALSSVQTIIEQKASQYILLDDALKPGADPSKLQYVVMPHVDASGALLKNRGEELDRVFAKRPGWTLIASFADDVLQVGDNFCADSSALPYCIKKIAFMGKNVSKIGDRFLSGNNHLFSVDMTNLPALESIGDEFASYAQALTSLNLSNLTALESIGSEFGSEAQALTSLNLSNLTALKSIGHEFASHAQALTSLNLSNLTALESIGRAFAARTGVLRSLTLFNLTALKYIEGNFALGAITLETLDMRGVNTEVWIDRNFLKDAPATARILVDSPIVAETIRAVYKGEAQIIVE